MVAGTPVAAPAVVPVQLDTVRTFVQSTVKPPPAGVESARPTRTAASFLGLPRTAASTIPLFPLFPHHPAPASRASIGHFAAKTSGGRGMSAAARRLGACAPAAAPIRLAGPSNLNLSAAKRLPLRIPRPSPIPSLRTYEHTTRPAVAAVPLHSCEPLHRRTFASAAPVATSRSKLRAPAAAMVAEDFETVLKGKYPAKEHAKRVVQLIREKVPDANGLLYLEGRMTKLQEDNDSPEHFRYACILTELNGRAPWLTLLPTQPAPILLLPDRLQPRRLLLRLRHPVLQVYPLHPSHRPRRRHLVRSAPQHRRGPRQIRCRRGQVLDRRQQCPVELQLS